MTDAAPWQPFPWLLHRATGLPFSWFEALGEEEPAWALPDTPERWSLALDRAREALHTLAERPLFREAVFVSNPALDPVYDRYLRSLTGPRDAAAKKRERALLRYAQRLTAKNDSTSFFGAVAPGRLDGAAYSGQPVPIAALRRAYLTHWAASTLLARAASDLRDAGLERDLPRLAPGALITPEGDGGPARVARLRLGSGARLEITQTVEGRSAELLARAADGTRERAALIALAEPGGAEALGALFEAELLLPWFTIPAGADDPLAEARARLADQPAGELRERWRERLDAVARSCERFAEGGLGSRRAALTELEERFEAWTGAPARRRAGSFYASRGLVHEVADRVGEPLGLPPGAPAEIASGLAEYLELSLLEPAAERLKLRAWFGRAYGEGGRSLPWREIAPRFHRERVHVELAAPPEARELARLSAAIRDRVRAQLDAQIADLGVDRPARVNLDELRPLLAEARPLLDLAGVAYANPDVMLIPSDSGPIPLLAEAHHLPTLTPSLLLGLADRDAIIADTRRFLSQLCAPARPALISAYHHSFISAAPDLGEVALELSGPSPRPPERRASFAELRVSAVPGGFRFTAPSHAGDLVEIAPLTRVTRLDRASPVFPVSALDLPRFLGARWRWPSRLPRISWGGLLVHRRRWRVASKRWASGRTPQACAALLRKHCGDAFPRFTFLRAEGEPKPLLFDWANPIAVELAIKLARRIEILHFTEMLPGPEDLWLRGPEGLHTAEARMVLARRAGGWGL